MQSNVRERTGQPDAAVDKMVALAALAAVLALALILQHEFATRQSLLFLLGTGLGLTLYHASFGFTGGWRRFVREGTSDGVQAQILLLAATSLLFFPVFGGAFETVKASPALGPVGVSVLAGAFLFGIGMQLGGGCGSGTLFTVGGGHVRMLITLLFFVAGAVLGSAHLHWWLALPSFGRISLPNLWGWQAALAVQLAALAGLFVLVRWIERRRRGGVSSLMLEARGSPVDRLIFGPWPLWWGVAALTLLGFATLLIAGHPWTITFAFGLWGAKVLSGLGVDVASWPYWSSGYPAKALAQSVLADTTTLMDIGIIVGAVTAAALAGKFAPEGDIRMRDAATAIVGGLLLGYGARLAFGCNIGALLAGIASGSVHGWLWLMAGFAGSMLGVRLRILIGVDEPLEES